MPSPIAHSLAGLAVAALARRKGWIGAAAAWPIAFVVAANAPDLDFLPGFWAGSAGWFHHGPTHSLTAVAVVAVAGAGLSRAASARSAPAVGVAVAIAYLSHVLLDCLMIRTSPSTEVALFWPFFDRPLASPIQLFLPIRHDKAGQGFIASLWQLDNLYAVAVEVLLALAVYGIYWQHTRWRLARHVSRHDRR